MKELASAKTGSDTVPAEEACGLSAIIMARSML
jgi:hypothetical protein